MIRATSGLGEQFARQFHGLGKKVIITGRRAERLSALKKELPGLETYQWDVAKIHEISHHTQTILKSHPDIDGVLINSGQQQSFFWADPSGSTDASIETEIATNLTAPSIMLRTFVLDLIGKAGKGNPVALFMTSSGLAYTPIPMYPVYSGTKSAIHTTLVNLRQQIGFQPDVVKQNFNVCEIAPPYVDTDLNADHRERNIALQGGPEKATKPMPLMEYINTTMKQLHETGSDAKMHKEIGTGFSEMGIKAWRGAFDPIYKNIGMPHS